MELRINIVKADVFVVKLKTKQKYKTWNVGTRNNIDLLYIQNVQKLNEYTTNNYTEDQNIKAYIFYNDKH